MNIPSLIKIKRSPNGKGLFARKIIKKGSPLFHFNGQIGDDAHTNPKALQIDEDKFLESTAKFDDFLNHSCEPNCYIDWQRLNLIALKDIQEGEELTYNYCTSDWDDVNLIKDCSFKCKCGSKNCIGEVKGFRYLSMKQKKEIQKFISPFLRNKFKQEQKTPDCR